MYSIYGYLVGDDACEILCETCAFQALQDNDHLPRRVRAAVKLAALQWNEPDVNSVRRILQERAGYPNYSKRDETALRDFDREVVPLYEDGSESQGGEWCGGCSTELVEPWADCIACGRDSNLSSLGGGPFAVTDDGNGEALKVVCQSCADDWRETVDRAGARITETEWEDMRRATDPYRRQWDVPLPALSLVAKDATEHPANEWRKAWTSYEYRWAPGRVFWPLRYRRAVEAGQGVLTLV
jgi:hypothetical protein